MLVFYGQGSTCWCKPIFHTSYRRLGEVNGNDSASNSSGKDMGLVTHKSNCSLGEAMKKAWKQLKLISSDSAIIIALHWSYQFLHIEMKWIPSKYVHCSNSIMKKERQTRKGWMWSRQDREKWRMTLIWHAKHCKLPFYEGISLLCFLRDKWSAIPGHTHLERDPKSDCCNRALHVVPWYQLFSLSIFLNFEKKIGNWEIHGFSKFFHRFFPS